MGCGAQCARHTLQVDRAACQGVCSSERMAILTCSLDGVHDALLYVHKARCTGVLMDLPYHVEKKRYVQKAMRFSVFKRDQFACRYCGRKVPEVTLELDHVLPFSKGGDNSMGNLVTACRECNNGKREHELDTLPPPAGSAAPPDRKPAAWERHTTVEEDERVEVLRRRLWLIELRQKETRSELQKIMHRAIRRMRRAEGKE